MRERSARLHAGNYSRTMPWLVMTQSCFLGSIAEKNGVKVLVNNNQQQGKSKQEDLTQNLCNGDFNGEHCVLMCPLSQTHTHSLQLHAAARRTVLWAQR